LSCKICLSHNFYDAVYPFVPSYSIENALSSEFSALFKAELRVEALVAGLKAEIGTPAK
jgi:hypothetical protein